jgi:hypothetical protein
MSKVERKCDNCQKLYTAKVSDLNRGWGKCCSKSCAAELREKSKPDYNPERVAINNIRRENWNNPVTDENLYGKYTGKRTSEGYKIYGNTAIDEFGDPVYTVTGEDDAGDSEYWNK